MSISPSMKKKLMEPGIPQKWLRHSTTPAEAERLQLERTATAFNLPMEKVIEKFGARPFGAATARWRDFIKQLREKDELWFFSSPDESFAMKLGCLGYAIVRNGVICETFIALET